MFARVCTCLSNPVVFLAIHSDPSGLGEDRCHYSGPEACGWFCCGVAWQVTSGCFLELSILTSLTVEACEKQCLTTHSLGAIIDIA